MIFCISRSNMSLSRDFIVVTIVAILAVRKGQGKDISWEVHVVTSDISNADTDTDVHLQIIGTAGKSPSIAVDNDEDNFERKKTDTFVIQTADIGTPVKLRVWHDNSEDKPGWHLTRVELRRLDGSSIETYIFNCDCWLAKDEGDRKIDRTLPVSKENWRVWVKTSDIDSAGTTSRVWMVIYGNKGATRQIPLSYEGTHFLRGGSDVFMLSTVDIGKPYKIRMVTENNDPWHLDQVELENMNGAVIYTFECDCWLAKPGYTAEVIEVSKPSKAYEKMDPRKDV